MRRRARLLVAVLATGLLLGAASPAAALDPQKAVTQYSRQAWRTEEGLPQNSVQAILQTRDGYLWLGTQEGIVRFDGVRFTVFDRRSAPAFRNTNVLALAESRDGSLWIATGGGGLLRLKDGRFEGLGAAQGLTSEALWALAEDRDGNLWVGTSGGGLCRLRDGKVTVYAAREGLPSPHVLSLHVGRTGALWVGTDGAGVARLEGGRVTATYTTKEGLPDDAVYAIREDAEGRLWVATGGGLARLEDDGRFAVWTTRDGLPAARVEALLFDGRGNLWAGTYGGGLARLKDGRIEVLSSRDGLSNDMVKALYEDREGSLWVGTRTGGLNRLKDGAAVTLSVREGLPHDIVRTVHADRGGAVWIGTEGGGLARLADGLATRYTTRDGLADDAVRCVLEDGRGTLWIGTANGLTRLEKGRFTTLTTRDGLGHNSIRALYEDREGSLWIGTFGGGLSRYRGGALQTFTTKDGLGADTIYCLHQDRQGDLWIGTRGGGLSRYRNGAFTTFTTRDGLADDVILAFHEDAAGLWIGTTGGLHRFEFRSGRFSVVTRRDGLFDDVAYQILEDGRGQFWMSSNRGIYRVRKAALLEFLAGRAAAVASVSYGKGDGMRSAECNGGVQPAGTRTADGRLWFPTIEGVAVVDPEDLGEGEAAPPVVVEEVAIDGREVDPAAAVAPPGRGDLVFRYAGLSFLAPERLRFRRRLQGYDPDWVDAGSRREAHYTNIPPGDYVFLVAASHEEGPWTEPPSEVRLRLSPHLHQTPWFRGALALSFVLASAGLYRRRVVRLRTRGEALAREVDERTRDLLDATRRLEEANRELREAIRLKDEIVAVVARDFRAPLTLVQSHGSTLEARAPDEETRRLVGIVNAQSRHLASLAEDTLTMSRIETGSLPLEVGDVRLSALVRQVVEARSADPGARVSFEAPDDGLVVRADPDRLYQVVDNLVGNAVKYSPEGGRVRVTVARVAEGVRVSVADEGMGIPPDDLPKLFRRFSRLDGGRRRGISGTGLGLYICRSIVEAHGGRIWAESTPGRGSTFHVLLPPYGMAA